MTCSRAPIYCQFPKDPSPSVTCFFWCANCKQSFEVVFMLETWTLLGWYYKKVTSTVSNDCNPMSFKTYQKYHQLRRNKDRLWTAPRMLQWLKSEVVVNPCPVKVSGSGPKWYNIVPSWSSEKWSCKIFMYPRTKRSVNQIYAMSIGWPKVRNSIHEFFLRETNGLLGHAIWCTGV